MKKQLTWILVLLLFLAAAILSVLNVDPVPVNFGFTTVQWPLILVIVGSLIIGALIASLLSGIRFYSYNKEVKELNRQVADAAGKEEKKLRETEMEYQNKVNDLNQQLGEKNQIIRSLERKLANTQVHQKRNNE